MVSTPSSTNARITASEPLIAPSWPPPTGEEELVFVCNASVCGCFNVSCIFKKYSFSCLQAWLRPTGFSPFKFSIPNLKRNGICCCVDCDNIIILDQCDGTAVVRFGSDVSNHKTMRAAAKATVCDQCHGFSQT